MVVCDGTNVRFLSYIYDNNTVTGNLTVTGNASAGGSIAAGTTSSDAIGNLREVPANSQTGSYTLQATDSGKYISITTGGVTVPQSIFTTGQTISIYNNSSSSQTITQGAGTTLRLVGTATTGNRTLAQYGVATILCVGSNVFVITGGGLT
jgi:phage gp45-like